MQNKNINYLDFHNYDALTADKSISDKLVESYQNIFGDPKLWGESYSDQDINDKLQDELSGKASLRLCINGEGNREVLGFCWAQLLNLDGVKSAIESIQFYKTLGSPKIRETLKSILKDESVLYLHDLGIAKQCRGKVSLQNLICPVLNSLAKKSNTQRLFFWSIKDSRIFNLAKYTGFKLAATVDGMQFFIGDINTTRVRAVCK